MSCNRTASNVTLQEYGVRKVKTLSRIERGIRNLAGKGEGSITLIEEELPVNTASTRLLRQWTFRGEAEGFRKSSNYCSGTKTRLRPRWSEQKVRERERDDCESQTLSRNEVAFTY